MLSPSPVFTRLPSRGRPRLAVAVLTLCLGASALAGCGSPTGEGGDSNTSDASAVAPVWDNPEAGKSDGAPDIAVPTIAAPSELVIEDIDVGDGAEVADGTLALVDYTGALFSDGSIFDASFNRAPFPVVVGAGSVIAGWDKGLIGMKAGGTRQLIIPPDLGYGDQDNGDIPSDSTLIFVITARAAFERPAPIAAPDGAATELIIDDITEGYGDLEVADGDRVAVHYVLSDGVTGAEISASWDDAQPFPLVVGNDEVIAGWDLGLVGMKLGGRRTLVIPPDLGYGAEGRPPAIAPNATLVFTVDLVGLKR